MWAKLGNSAVVTVTEQTNPDGTPKTSKDGTPLPAVRTPVGGLRVTGVDFPEGTTLGEAFRTVTDPKGVWAAHSDQPPTWVDSDSPGLAALLAEHFGCAVGVPEDVEATHHTEHGPPGVGLDGPLDTTEVRA